ncbi:hypothetical protein LVD17_21445 [Fulvivirga ulvae]|uniref:hypothetical protein n=1 Tax=Fulvivirga ulvae TaxID=2904245 RepID=UPI001F2C1B39|nr:hypothetical protein [Fulvivirga ulvae]UII30862.1 hypothetical protein LVD17_21445 [Fulvivirga ulvae]
MNKILTIAFISAFTVACESGKKEESEQLKEPTVASESVNTLEKDMVGEWRNVAMKVTIKGEQADSVVDVPAGKWEEMLKIQPIRTVFNEDGTFSSEYRDLDDAVIMTSAGTWAVNGDTLKMTQEGTTTYYFTKVKDGIAEFEGNLDWDEDGDADDHYWGKQRKQGKQND